MEILPTSNTGSCVAKAGFTTSDDSDAIASSIADNVIDTVTVAVAVAISVRERVLRAQERENLELASYPFIDLLKEVISCGPTYMKLKV